MSKTNDKDARKQEIIERAVAYTQEQHMTVAKGTNNGGASEAEDMNANAKSRGQ